MNRRVKLITAIFAVVLSLALGEIFLRMYFGVHRDYDIEMWRYAVNFKQSVSDDRSHVHTPNSRGSLMGVPIAINSKGLRDSEYDYKKPEGVYRILIVGDSLTFGWGVESQDTFSGILEKRLNEQNTLSGKYKEIQVINAGIGNYNTTQELVFLREDGLKYEPDEVMLAHFTNDAEQTQREANNFLTRNFILYASTVSFKNKIIAVFDDRRNYEYYYKGLYREAYWAEYQKVLTAFEDETKKYEIKLTVLLLPEFHDLVNYQLEDEHQKMVRFFKERGVAVMDSLEVFRGEEGRSFWVASDDSHPNASAHRIIADFLFEKMRNTF